MKENTSSGSWTSNNPRTTTTMDTSQSGMSQITRTKTLKTTQYQDPPGHQPILRQLPHPKMSKSTSLKIQKTIQTLDNLGHQTILRQLPHWTLHNPWWVRMLPEEGLSLYIPMTIPAKDISDDLTSLKTLWTSPGRCRSVGSGHSQRTHNIPPCLCQSYREANLKEQHSPVKKLQCHSEHGKTQAYPSPSLEGQSQGCWARMH